ncbi:putative ribonuclease H-like domain-containing protein [Tanacetum coccineum]
MGLLRDELEKVKQEKEGFEFKIAKFDKSVKDLEQLLASQITDKSKKGFGYNVVPLPHPFILNRLTPLDLSYSGLEEFKEPESLNPKVEKKTVIPTATKKEFVKPEKQVKRSVSCPKHMAPRAVLMKTGLKPVNTARPVNTVRSINTDRPFSTARRSHDGESSLKENGTADQQVNTASPEINTGSREVSTALPEVNTATPEDLVGPSPASEDSHVEDQEIELGNIPQSYEVPTTPHTRIHKDHPIKHVIGDEEPKRVSQALRDPAWVEAMQEELLQFKLQKVWILVDLPKGHRAIGTKWVYRNKKDERGIVIKNKARLVAQGHTQEESIDYGQTTVNPTKVQNMYSETKYDASHLTFA